VPKGQINEQKKRPKTMVAAIIKTAQPNPASHWRAERTDVSQTRGSI